MKNGKHKDVITKYFDVEESHLDFTSLEKWLNVLGQQRKRFISAELLELTGAIESEGRIFNPLLIVKLNKSRAREYVKLVHDLHGGRRTLNGLKTYRGMYYFLLAGEKRLRCAASIYQGGGSLPAIPVNIYAAKRGKQPDLLELQLTQIRENCHSRPDAYTESANIYSFWKLYNGRQDGNITYVGLAKQLSGLYSIETITNAVKFHEMPDYIKREVDNGNMAYTAAIEIKRLVDADCDEKIIRYFLRDAILWSLSATQIKKRTFQLIEHLSAGDNGQNSLFQTDLADVTQMKLFMDSKVRSIQGFMALATLFAEHSRKANLLGEDTKSLYSDHQVAGPFLTLLGFFEDTAHVLNDSKTISSSEYQRALIASYRNKAGLKDSRVH